MPRPEREVGTRKYREHAERIEEWRHKLRRRWPFAKHGDLQRGAEALAAGRELFVYAIQDPTDVLKARILVGGSEPDEPNLSGTLLLRALERK